MPSRLGRPPEGPLRLLLPVIGPRRWRCCSGAEHHDRAGRAERGRHVSGVSSRPSKARRESARTRFPPRPVITDWPATRHDRGAVWVRLTSGVFVLDNANSQDRRLRGLAWLLDWLADQPGET